ncbi:hypothetical protein V1291_000243 [Nitrobacteraceae bacterium AZCC 1564]
MAILDFIVDMVGYTTSRVLLPILTFQKVRVDALAREQRGFNWLGLKRLSDGTLLCDATSAGWIGTFFWAFVLIAIVAMI